MNNILVPVGWRLLNEGETITKKDLIILNYEGSTTLKDWEKCNYYGMRMGKIGNDYAEFYPRIRKIEKLKNSMKKITIDNKDYNIDIERAKTLGILKEAITVDAGDKFIYQDGKFDNSIFTVIKLNVNGKHKYIFGGVLGNSHYCFNTSLKSYDEFIDYITTNDYQKIS